MTHRTVKHLGRPGWIVTMTAAIAISCTEPVGSPRRDGSADSALTSTGGSVGMGGAGGGGPLGGQPGFDGGVGAPDRGGSLEAGGADATGGTGGTTPRDAAAGAGGQSDGPADRPGTGGMGGGSPPDMALPPGPDGPPLGDCIPPAKRCGANHTPETCSGGRWVAGTRCDFVCSGMGDCTGECRPGQTQCRGTVAESCSSSGRWASGTGDCTPPTVVSVAPANGASGIRRDAKIMITFSEPMNRSSAEMAFASVDVASRSFSWDSSGSILTITPTGGLQYASGGNTSVVARTYSFSMGTAAADLAGNRLDRAASSAFATLRKITWQARQVVSMTGFVEEGGGFFRDYAVHYVDCSPNGNRTFLTFDISDLPGGIVDFETASVTVFQKAQEAAPFPNSPIELADIRFDEFDHSTFHVGIREVLGTVASTAGMGMRQVGGAAVITALRDDYSQRSANMNRTQFRMATRAAQCVGGASFDNVQPTAAGLSAEYLIP